jgi:hypothetical protein
MFKKILLPLDVVEPKTSEAANTEALTLAKVPHGHVRLRKRRVDPIRPSRRAIIASCEYSIASNATLKPLFGSLVFLRYGFSLTAPQ